MEAAETAGDATPVHNSNLPVCLLLASVGGICTTLAVNVLAYPQYRHSLAGSLGPAQPPKLLYVINIVLMLVGIAFFVLASGNGPVSIAMPIQSASNLLSNMVLQTKLGMKVYSKSMMTGTLVLVGAIICLPDVGPSDVASDADPFTLLSSPTAIVYVAVMFASMANGIVLLGRNEGIEDATMTPKKTQAGEWDQVVTVFTYAVVAGASTVLGASVGKCLTMVSGFIRFGFFLLYLGLGVICLGAAARASAHVDPALYVPVAAGLQLVFNCLAGLCIWEDWRTVQHWVSYVMVYLLVVLGVYLVSSFDAGKHWSLKRAFSDTQLSKSQFVGPFGTAVDSLITAFREDPGNKAALADKLRRMLEQGIETHTLTDREIVKLVVKLFGAVETARGTRSVAEILIDWVQTEVANFEVYKQYDPDIEPYLQALLTKKPASHFSQTLSRQLTPAAGTPTCVCL
mmetsp:Transcript_45161/g.125271  ORF Transcript_45161/g.125271 Transcript_45161/m.125271 type:complete len:457 (+) Transcript_45161:97-1467(+)|eukprot:CAMPEP_0117538350 /NCGR_PEP_ID=MMETSP0784-20121206/42434_1 /TAXON_ID=39447 /ORGANISM="" /LENGTH=456 /DNA_ID=CAMNT_0005334963 /DNA_START=28 /DNA_END=1398 /DNA_ORIENTATION=+